MDSSGSPQELFLNFYGRNSEIRSALVSRHSQNSVTYNKAHG